MARGERGSAPRDTQLGLCSPFPYRVNLIEIAHLVKFHIGQEDSTSRKRLMACCWFMS